MKKYIAIFGLLVIFATSILFHSCIKDQIQNDKSINQTEQAVKDAQIKTRILAFKDKLDLIRENPSLKTSNEPMEIDSAIWYIEAASNFTYGDASTELEGYVVDSSFIEVPTTNGQILWADVQAAYDKVIDSLSAHNAAITAAEKQLIVADISLKETDDNSVVLEVTSGFGTDGVSGFLNDHSWYWGWELGTCDGSGYGVGWDAADKIAQLANYEIAVPIGTSAYYTDVEYKDVYPYNYYDNNGNTLLFSDFQEYNVYPLCLSPTDITHYKSTLIYIGVQEKPIGKSMIRYELRDATMYGSCGYDNHDCWYMDHIAKLKYAIWHSDGVHLEL